MALPALTALKDMLPLSVPTFGVILPLYKNPLVILISPVISGVAELRETVPDDEAPVVFIAPVVMPLPITVTPPPKVEPVVVSLPRITDPLAAAITLPPAPFAELVTIVTFGRSIVPPAMLRAKLVNVVVTGESVVAVPPLKLKPARSTSPPPFRFPAADVFERSIVLALPVLTILEAEIIARLDPLKTRLPMDFRSSGLTDELAIVPAP